jgi:hypothetical protein
VSGAVAGSIASTATLPFDVIKTAKQIEIGDMDIMQVKKGILLSSLFFVAVSGDFFVEINGHRYCVKFFILCYKILK